MIFAKMHYLCAKKNINAKYCCGKFAKGVEEIC